MVPDSAVTVGGSGAVPSGGQVSLDDSHEEAGQGEPGAAGRTPHPAGRQVRTSRHLTSTPNLSAGGRREGVHCTCCTLQFFCQMDGDTQGRLSSLQSCNALCA